MIYIGGNLNKACANHSEACAGLPTQLLHITAAAPGTAPNCYAMHVFSLRPVAAYWVPSTAGSVLCCDEGSKHTTT